MSYKILIADDEKLERQAIKKIISENCHEISEIFEAENGIVALNRFIEHTPDIFFCDIKMPGMNGIDVIKKINQTNHNCYIVFLSAYDYFNYAQEAIKLGVEEYILKPAEDTSIINIVKMITKKLDSKKNAELKQKSFTERFTFLDDFFKKSYISTLIANGNIPDFLKQSSSYISKDFPLSIIAAICITANKKDNTQLTISHSLIMQIEEVFTKSQLDYLSEEIKNIAYFIIYPKDENSAADTEKKINTIFNELPTKNLSTNKEESDVNINLFATKIVANTPSALHEGFLQLQKIIQSDSVSSTKNDDYVKISPRLDQLMRQTANNLEKNYMNQISLDEVAASVKLSSFYFSKLFKQFWGKNFTDYINDIRIKKACVLLADPTNSIKEIAFASGFSDAAYFTRVFKNICNETPSEYRKRIL